MKIVEVKCGDWIIYKSLDCIVCHSDRRTTSVLNAHKGTFFFINNNEEVQLTSTFSHGQYYFAYKKVFQDIPIGTWFRIEDFNSAIFIKINEEEGYCLLDKSLKYMENTLYSFPNDIIIRIDHIYIENYPEVEQIVC